MLDLSNEIAAGDFPLYMLTSNFQTKVQNVKLNWLPKFQSVWRSYDIFTIEISKGVGYSARRA